MRLLVVGCGSIGHRHIQNLVRLGEKDLVLVRSGRGTARWDDLAGFPTVTSLEDGLARRPDAVIVSNPTSLHVDVATRAVRAGCHVLLEKPVSHDLEGVEALAKAVAAGPARLLVAFQYRFHPSLRKAEELLRAGAVGKVLSARAHYGDYLPDWHPWEDHRRGYSARADLGGGVALTLCHPFDYLRWLLGEIDSVQGFSATLGSLGLDPGVEDTAEVILRHRGGARSSVHVDYCQRPPAHRLEIVGSEGALRWEQGGGGLQVYRAARREWEAHPEPAGHERNDMFLEELRHFLAVARGEATPACTLEDGVAATRVAIAVRDLGPEGGTARLGGEVHAARPAPRRPALVVFDFDGVMTDNRVWVDAAGNELVAASRGDGLGISMLRRAGLPMLVLSTEENRVVAARCAKLGLEVLQGQKDKAAALRRILAERKLDPAEVIYVGNDVNDLGCFEVVGWTVAPADAHPEVLRRADLVLAARGGHGAVRELCDRLLRDLGGPAVRSDRSAE